MSGIVSYELLSQRLGDGKIGFTLDGGVYLKLTNNTGTSVKGTIVVTSLSIDNGVDIAPANTKMPIGVIYESGISNGSQVKVVIYGRAQVLLKNDESATRGYWCGVSDIAGRMYQDNIAPSTTEHYREIGHSLESKSAGTNVLSYILLHFN